MISCYFEDGKKAKGKGLRHAVVDCILLSVDEEEILLVKRAPQMLQEPGKWALPGGYIDMDESVEEAVVREVREETGYELKEKPKLLFYVDSAKRGNEDRQNISFVWLGKAGAQKGAPDNESTEVKWWPLRALPEAAQVAFDHREIIGRALKRIKELKQEGLKMMVATKAVVKRENESGKQEILVLKSRSWSVSGGWRWDFPGGRVDADEWDLEQSLCREIKEELGWSEEVVKKLWKGKCLGVKIVDRPTLRSRLVCNFMELKLSAEIKVPEIVLSDEHLEYKWVAVEELGDLRDADGGRVDLVEGLKF